MHNSLLLIAPEQEQSESMTPQVALVIDLLAEKITERLGPKPESLTFGDLFENYMEQYAVLHCKTWKSMRRMFELHLSNWKDRRVDQISKSDVTNIQVKIGEATGRHQANRVLQLVRTVYNFGVKQELIACKNPAKAFRKYEEQPRERFLSQAEAIRLLKAIRGLRYKATRDILLLLLLTGQRKINVLSMRWSDIDLDRANWNIRGSEMKNRKSHNIPLVKEALSILEARKSSDSDSDWVFPAHGKSSNKGRSDLWRGWQQALKDARLLKSDLRIHDLRRTLASWQVMTGADIRVVAATLNHCDLKSTMIYGRLNTEKVKKAIEIAMAGMCGEEVESEIERASGLDDVRTLKKSRTVSLTDAFIRDVNLPSDVRWIEYSDTDVEGLLIRVKKSGLKVFVVRRQYRHKPVSFTLGKHPQLSLGRARELAKAAASLFDAGIDARTVVQNVDR